VVTFSRFWAGKFHIHAKIRCVIANHCHGVSPTKQNKKNTKGMEPNKKNGRERMFRAGDGTLGGKRNFTPYGT
jgi:hypothetical protein